jgi:hypothetical protein
MSGSICPICYVEFCDCEYTELDCGHKYCDECLRQYIKDKLDDKETNIYCPIEFCDEHINLSTIEKVDDDDLVERYQRYNNFQNLDLKQHSMCPKCEKICQKDETSNKVYCYDCSDDYCFVCRESHCYYDYCSNESDINDTISEIMSALDNDDVKLCPICKIVIEKTEGCSSMRCKYCKVKFCWHCLQTNSAIEKIGRHACEDYRGFHQTESDDEYVDGFDDE